MVLGDTCLLGRCSIQGICAGLATSCPATSSQLQLEESQTGPVGLFRRLKSLSLVISFSSGMSDSSVPRPILAPFQGPACL